MISIEKFTGRLQGTIPLTPSKSITNRALVIRALSKDKFEIINQATANDSVLLDNILENPSSEIDVEDAGTAGRFLTAYLSCVNGNYFLTGTERMKERPVGILVDALRNLGAKIKYAEREGYLPLQINGTKLKGGRVAVNASVSSQFISALMLIGPILQDGLLIETLGRVASEPYVQMTAGIMRDFGIEIDLTENIIHINSQKYSAKDFIVENDWSGASFWYIMAAMAEDAELLLKGLTKNSMQGDSVIAKMMEQFGVNTDYVNEGIILRKKYADSLTHFKFDFTNYPDLVIPLAVLCAAENVFAEFDGVENLRHKESDRILAIRQELERTGCRVVDYINSMKIIPRTLELTQSIDVHNDHRIAMAFAGLAMKTSVSIDNEHVVKKSYPEFWNHLELAGLKIKP